MTANTDNSVSAIYQRFNGEISITTGKVNLISSQLTFNPNSNSATLRFRLNQISPSQDQTISFTLSNTIKSGTYDVNSPDTFQSASYIEHLRQDEFKFLPYQSDAVAGKLTIEVIDSGTGQRTYNVTDFNITVKANQNSSDTQTLNGKFIVTVDDVTF